MKTNFANGQFKATSIAREGQCCGGRSRGFTVVELLTTVAIVGILLSIAIPSFGKMISDNRALAGASSLAQAMTFARSQAIKLGRPVTLCPSSDGATCTASTTFDQGWLVAVDTISNVATAPVIDTTLTNVPSGILMTTGAMKSSAAAKTAGQSWIRFLPRGMATEVSTITVKPSGTCKTGYSWQQLDVGVVGRISISKKAC